MGVTFPYGGPGLHTCLCGEKWKEAPELKVMGIQLGCMADIILKSLIDSYKPPLITPDYYGPLIWE